MYVSGPLAGYTTNYIQSDLSNSSESNSFQDALESSSQQDQVEISQQGASLAVRLYNIESLIEKSPGEDGYRNHRIDMQALYQENSAALGSNISGLLASYGVDTSKPIDLTVDSQGMIRVPNDHPDKEKIEEILEENPEICDQFVKVSAMGGFLKSAEDYQPFIEEYARDPQAAFKKYFHLFFSIKKVATCRLENGILNVL